MAKIYATERVRRLLKVKEISAHHKKLVETSQAFADGWLTDHRAAVVWAQELLSRPDTWCANDTETTHVDEAAEIIEIAIVAANKQSLVDQLVLPSKPPNPRTSEIHGITMDMLRGKPTWPMLVPRINEVFATRREVLIYNSAFETRLYEQTSFGTRAPVVVLPPTITDPLQFVAKFIGEWDWAHNGWKYPKLEGGHRAAGDCVAMIELIEAMASSPIDKL